MPKGPQGQKRPADTIGCASLVAKIATGEEKEYLPSGRRASGIAGSTARAENLTEERRREIARRAAKARWSNDNDNNNREGAI